MKRLSVLLPLLLLAAALPGRTALIDDMNAAREATRQGKLQQLVDITARTDGTALEMYPRYWLLAAQIDILPEAEVAAFLARYEGSPLADRLRGDWLKSLAKRGDWTVFEREWPRLVSWEAGSELHCDRLQLAIQRNDRALLAREGKPLWFTPRGLSDACAPVFEALFGMGLLDQEDGWRRLRLTFEANNPDFAAQLLPRLGLPAGIDAKRIRAVAANPTKALPTLALGTRGGRELALFAIGRAGRSDPDAGRALLARVAGQLPEADRRYAQSRLAYHAARRLDDRALDWYGDGLTLAQLDDESRDWYVRSALRLADWRAVANGIDAMPAEEQREVAWRYWRARAWQEAGKPAEAQQRFAELAGEHHFYGLLAREELGTVADTAAGHYKPSAEELLAVRQIPAVERALALLAMDWRSEAVREWNWGMRGLSDTQLLAAAEVARQSHWYDRAIYSAERTRTLHDFNLRFLAPYRDVTQGYARGLGLDEAWVYGLIRQESRFVQVARSGVGASGLMQLMPATARWVAKKMGVGYDAGAVNEVGTNVQLGTWYLKHVLDSLGSQPVLATAAYNAGPGRARNWRADRPLEGAIYAETIPFSETRDYVKKVMANAVYYAQAFGRGETSLKKRLGAIPPRGGNDAADDDDTP
ncbi:lytic transglycosylase domain-containing protein [Chitinimonas koreensis]|uniref:lytic transglycosylase domain-containing protein n=1 Tax=Chitinimonas koreensis TaxID=356302 RepID=UPI000424A29E|nr:lytic transglycosylase domain-containing protein [Chitinimonas koreensis]QNM97335.1 lytic transglycosylase domain-containing protein [Chitinimonas koreensis]